MASPTQQTLYEVLGFSSTDLYAVGAAGTVRHWDGSAWTPQAAGGGG